MTKNFFPSRSSESVTAPAVRRRCVRNSHFEKKEKNAALAVE